MKDTASTSTAAMAIILLAIFDIPEILLEFNWFVRNYKLQHQ